MKYYSQSANSYIEPKKDSYFNNEIILRQFERLFKLVKFKKSFYHHDIEILVDNATTHVAKVYDLNLISKFPNTNCPYKTIEFEVNGENIKINCFDENGISKGLLKIAKEIGIIDNEAESRSINLENLRNLCSSHKAFKSITKLEQLADKYGIKIVWCPKYHCELNPIEGFWCYSKQYVRANNEQIFDRLNDLIIESIDKYKKNVVHFKLCNRFWETIEMYQNGSSYKNVLQSLFGAKKESENKSHTKIYNTNLN
jgi:transposase